MQSSARDFSNVYFEKNKDCNCLQVMFHCFQSTSSEWIAIIMQKVVTCYICGILGHKARNCRKKEGASCNIRKLKSCPEKTCQEKGNRSIFGVLCKSLAPVSASFGKFEVWKLSLWSIPVALITILWLKFVFRFPRNGWISPEYQWRTIAIKGSSKGFDWNG